MACKLDVVLGQLFAVALQLGFAWSCEIINCFGRCCHHTLVIVWVVEWRSYIDCQDRLVYTHSERQTHTHTHARTHTHPFNGPFSGTTQVSRYQKGKTNLDVTEAGDSEWQWNHLDHMQVCTLLQTDNHISTPPLSFLQAWCPSCRPTNSVKALKAIARDKLF